MAEPNVRYAFPVPDSALTNGLTKREYFAALAMQGLIASGHNAVEDREEKTWQERACQRVSMAAASYADALIEELNK